MYLFIYLQIQIYVYVNIYISTLNIYICGIEKLSPEVYIYNYSVPGSAGYKWIQAISNIYIFPISKTIYPDIHHWGYAGLSTCPTSPNNCFTTVIATDILLRSFQSVPDTSFIILLVVWPVSLVFRNKTVFSLYRVHGPRVILPSMRVL